jgi:hypothetical protein
MISDFSSATLSSPSILHHHQHHLYNRWMQTFCCWARERDAKNMCIQATTRQKKQQQKNMWVNFRVAGRKMPDMEINTQPHADIKKFKSLHPNNSSESE